MALRLTLESLPIDVLLDIVAAGLSAADVLALKQVNSSKICSLSKLKAILLTPQEA